MPQVLLQTTPEFHQAVWRHLLPRRQRAEEAAFMYARRLDQDATLTFASLEWYPVPAKEFVVRSAYHMELSDEVRGRVIKRAHDLGASLVEFHSHMGNWPAAFSPSDFLGLEEFVPHVWWRLKGKPYLAIVVTKTGFDGLAWVTDPKIPRRLDGVAVGNSMLVPTQLSSLGRDRHER